MKHDDRDYGTQEITREVAFYGLTFADAQNLDFPEPDYISLYQSYWKPGTFFNWLVCLDTMVKAIDGTRKIQIESRKDEVKP